jgi:uncharacterized protein
VPFSLLESVSPELEAALQRLRHAIGQEEAVVVAYSGGVDSALVAAIAVEQLGEGAQAITGVSPALAPHLRQEAIDQARWLGIGHRLIATAELADPDYFTNPAERCYACKQALHGLLAPIAAAAGAARAEVGIDKQGVRQLSRALGLPWWDKPANPCLASRFPYGEPITAERLRRVAAAEDWLRSQGFPELRVRSQGQTARIELPQARLGEALQRWADPHLRQQLVAAFRQLGFSAVGLDLEGLVSGKLNRELAGND